MKSNHFEKSIAIALLMGVLTIIFCLIIADGVLGIGGLQIDNRDGSGIVYTNNKIGAVVFWLFIIGLPLLFVRWTKWWHTFPNLLLYFLLYFPVGYGFGNALNHMFLLNAGTVTIPAWISAIITAVTFWVIQSIVYLVWNLMRFILRKLKKA